MSKFLYGIHDFDPVWAAWVRDAGVSAWCVTTYAHQEPAGVVFAPFSEYDVTPIARLNWSHHGKGTIPPSATDDKTFAAWCGEFAKRNPHYAHFTIGNEPNWSVEWGGGSPITAQRYADCYLDAYDAVKAARPDAIVMPAAIAPWNIESGMGWVEYFAEMLTALHGSYDAINLHTYSRGYMPAAVASEDRMDAPWDRYRNGFRTYRDFLAVVPASRRHLPVHITEANGNGVWPADRSGWVQAAYAEIDGWNATPGTQKVCSLALFRWPKFDARWQFETKPGVHADFRDALTRGYRVPDIAPAAPGTGGHTLHIPTVLGGGPASPPSPSTEREWDARLTARGVKIETPALLPGQAYYRVARGRWFDPQEGGGKHHILVDVRSEGGLRMTGVPVRVDWPNNTARVMTQTKSGEPWAADYPMSPSRNEFSVRVADEFPSERVTGIGMGADLGGGFNAAEHTSTGLVFQVAQAATATTPPPQPTPPTPEPTPPVTPPTPQPKPDARRIDPRVMEAIMAVEAGRRTHNEDGNAIVRFEAHVFRSELRNDELWARHFRTGTPVWTNQEWRPSPTDGWRNIHTGRQADEYAVLEFAQRLNREAAYRSISVGAPQIMGFHHARLGYATAQLMWQAFTDSASAQMIAMCNFVLTDPALHAAINAHDFPRIGKIYNGQESAGEKYRAAYVRLWGQP